MTGSSPRAVAGPIGHAGVPRLSGACAPANNVRRGDV